MRSPHSREGLHTRMKIGLLGGGSIARVVADAKAHGRLPGVDILMVAGASDPPSARVQETADVAGSRPGSIEALIDLAPTWVLEAAGNSAARAYLPRLLNAGCNLVVMSIGALLETNVWNSVGSARTRGQRVVLPSGAIGGLDAVGAMGMFDDVESARITTTKKPAGLAGAPHLTRNAIGLPDDRPMVVFEGNALDAIEGFPANVNVAAALSLAALGAERTHVRIVADPDAVHTRHVIEVEGSAASLRIDVTAKPNPSNPRSSYLAGLSAAATIRDIARGAR